MNRFSKFAAVIGGLTAVVAFASVMGMPLPKFATQSLVAEHATEDNRRFNLLTGEIKSTRILALENAIAADERRAGDLELQAIQLEKVGQGARAVRDQVKLLRRAVSKREFELNGLRSK